MNNGYNPYRSSTTDQYSLLNNISNSKQQSSFFANRLAKLSLFGRNYEAAAIKNAKGIHANEDLSVVTDSVGYSYSIFSRKAYAMMQERTVIASLNAGYIQKLPILREYSVKVEIRDLVTKLANEIIVYNEDKKFCELEDLPSTYDEIIRKKIKEIFDRVYYMAGFSDGSQAWDICRDWLVEGFICREIIYDKKGKNIVGFQKLDPMSITPVFDPETGLKLWVQHPYDEQNRRIMLDAEIVYVSYAGSSNFMETSYVEPLIKPYNELKTLERSKILFNLINATMHKEFIIPTHGLSPAQAEQEIATLIADYKDHISFDDTTGQIFIDGSKDLPYSKEYWLPNGGEARPEMSIIEPGGHDLNENSMLLWFGNNFKKASKFPINRLDGSVGGGNIYQSGAELSHDDYNFSKFVGRLRTLFKDILLKPVILQLLLDFPEQEKNTKLYNDLNIKYYGNSEVEKARELANMQARATIANDLMNNLKRKGPDGEDLPVLHWKFIMKHVMEFTDDMMHENDKYWKEDESGGAIPEPGAGGPDAGGGGGDTAAPGADTETTPDTTTEPPVTGTETPEAPAEEAPPETPPA